MTDRIHAIDIADVVGPVVALAGVALAVLTFWRDLGDRRARRYSERFTSLLEMSATVADLGPYAGPDATLKSVKAHETMLSQFDLEARANAVLYLQAAGRLNRAGSLILAGGLVAYAVVLVLVPFVGPSASPAGRTSDEAIGGLIARLLMVSIAIGFFARGVVEGMRRWSTRRIRLAVGASDDLTREAMKDIFEGLRARAEAGASTAEAIAAPAAGSPESTAGDRH